MKFRIGKEVLSLLATLTVEVFSLRLTYAHPSILHENKADMHENDTKSECEKGITAEDPVESCSKYFSALLMFKDPSPNSFISTQPHTSIEDPIFQRIQNHGGSSTSWWNQHAKLRERYLKAFEKHLSQTLEQMIDTRSCDNLHRLNSLISYYVVNGGDQGIRFFQNLCQGHLSEDSSWNVKFAGREICANLLFLKRLNSLEDKNTGGQDVGQIWRNLTTWAIKYNGETAVNAMAERFKKKDGFDVNAASFCSKETILTEDSDEEEKKEKKVEFKLERDLENRLHDNDFGGCFLHLPGNFNNLRLSYNDWLKINEAFTQQLKQANPQKKVIEADSQNNRILNPTGAAWIPQMIRSAFVPLEAESKLGTNSHYFEEDKKKAESNGAESITVKTLDAHVSEKDKNPTPIQLDAYWYDAKNNHGPTVIFFNGNMTTKYQSYDIARWYKHKGINTLAITLRGYPGSQGSSSRDGELGMYLDMEAAVRHVLMEKNIPHNKIFLHGTSIGGTLAAAGGALFDFPIILDQTLHSANHVTKHVVPILPHGIIDASIRSAYPKHQVFPLPPDHFSRREVIETDELNNAEKLKKMKKDVFIIHSEKDHIMEPSVPHQLFEARYGQEPKHGGEALEKWKSQKNQSVGIIKDGEHAEAFFIDTNVEKKMEQFLRRQGFIRSSFLSSLLNNIYSVQSILSKIFK